MTKVNKPEDENIQSLHIAKLLSASHLVSHPVNVIADFRTAQITARL
jgi:hypothetical protein